MVGIITFHRATNYGAVLQTYALQQTLYEIGVENEIIDYRCEHIENHYSPKPSVSIKHPKRFIMELMEMSQKSRIRNVFSNFLENNIRLSKPLIKEELATYSEKYSTVICGSDQVWNPISTNNDYSYFLDFVSGDKNKISYAASLGIYDWDIGVLKRVENNLESFNAVSVREPESIDLIKKVYRGEIHIDVDPTILIDKTKWNKMADKSNMNLKDFLFVYVMQPSDELYEMANQLAEMNGLKILSFSSTEKKCAIGENVKGSSVYDFLWMIKNAKYVVTNSFHGLLFSIFFEKEFFWNYQTGKTMSNSRFDMLSENYGIGCRRYRENWEYSDYKKIDFVSIKRIMKEQKNESIVFLKNKIGEN